MSGMGYFLFILQNASPHLLLILPHQTIDLAGERWNKDYFQIFLMWYQTNFPFTFPIPAIPSLECSLLIKIENHLNVDQDGNRESSWTSLLPWTPECTAIQAASPFERNSEMTWWLLHIKQIWKFSHHQNRWERWDALPPALAQGHTFGMEPPTSNFSLKNKEFGPHI